MKTTLSTWRISFFTKNMKSNNSKYTYPPTHTLFFSSSCPPEFPWFNLMFLPNFCLCCDSVSDVTWPMGQQRSCLPAWLAQEEVKSIRVTWHFRQTTIASLLRRSRRWLIVPSTRACSCRPCFCLDSATCALFGPAPALAIVHPAKERLLYYRTLYTMQWIEESRLCGSS